MTTQPASDHERLEVWQRAMDLVVEIYRIARLLPVEERYGLCTQLRRAAVSIPANIAEGSARSSPRDRLRFLSFSRGSTSELETLLAVAERVNFVDSKDLRQAKQLCFRVSQLLNGLRRYVTRTALTKTSSASRVPRSGRS